MEFKKSLKCQVTKGQQKVIYDLITLYENDEEFQCEEDLFEFISAIAYKAKSVTLRYNSVDLEYEE
jgi:hypothetical protein